jgi:dolichol-phosphate hexosyltransferase
MPEQSAESSPASRDRGAALAQDSEARTKDEVTVVIPTLNEEEAVGPLIDEVKAQGFNKIVVADGYSRDRTVGVASDLGAEVLMQHGNGKAGALLTAFRVVSTPYLLVMDGDGSYDPSDIAKFLPLIGFYDFVKGVRARNENMSRLHRMGNTIITKTFDLLFGTFIGDVCSGMYLLRTEAVRNLHLEKHPLTVEQEIAAEMTQYAGPITTVPIGYRMRMGGTSKTKTWSQGFRDLLTNFDLARIYNPIMLFSAMATLILIPAIGVLGYALLLYLIFGAYHSGYFLAGLVLLVLGAQGFTVATIAAMLRRIERKLPTK